jgi:hypothetical protein
VDVDALAKRLGAIPGVVAVTLGGSRAQGTERPDSDWDFGLYYRGSIDVDAVAGFGEGEVFQPGDWGRLLNGGAWLTIAGERTDLIYRDLDEAEHWVAEAEAGRFVRDHAEGFVAGLPSYVLAAELALGRVLSGELPRPSFPATLRESAPPVWLGSAEHSLGSAATAAGRGRVAETAGMLAKAAIANAQAILAGRGEWTLSEKVILERAGLRRADTILASLGDRPDALGRAVDSMRTLLRQTPP